jgi:tRNA dimethylallyltransferase
MVGMSTGDLILLLGCTASGKSAASMEIARKIGAEILCIDSMQVYRRMDIGTAKPTSADRGAIRHHLLDIAEPGESFSVARFVELADAAIADIRSRGQRVLAVGGTPLYIMGLMFGLFDGPSADEGFREKLRARAAEEGTAALHAELAVIDPDAAERIHPNDMKRIERAMEVHHATGRPLSEMQVQWSSGKMRHEATVIGIRREREDLSRRINSRVRMMIEQGLVDEVRGLLAESGGMGPQACQALGYAQIVDHLHGAMSLDDAVEQIKIQTRQFAKHQRTWFRKFTTTRWVDAGVEDETPAIAAQLLDAIG